MPAAPPIAFPTIRYSAFDRLVARINRPIMVPHVLDAEPDLSGVWTVPAHVAADAMRVQS